jgi:hypothetical protein
MGTFDNVEVYVRYSEYAYDGQYIKFVTINEQEALTKHVENNDSDDRLGVYVNSERIATYVWRNGKWIGDIFNGTDELEYGTIIVPETRYYDAEPFNNTYNFIIGARGSGKAYAQKQKALREAKSKE